MENVKKRQTEKEKEPIRSISRKEKVRKGLKSGVIKLVPC